jgi:hypothetical protein
MLFQPGPQCEILLLFRRPAAMAGCTDASGGGASSWIKQAKAKSITRAAMPALIAARCSTTTKLIAGISFRHCHPRVI